MTVARSLAEAFLNSAVFWGAWIAIPVLMEVVPAVAAAFVALAARRGRRELCGRHPAVSLIVPVYNSAQTLEACLASIHDGTYPVDRLVVFCVDNGSVDGSREVFEACQRRFHDLALTWMETAQGKARALNAALYRVSTPYVVHLDSDGVLEPHALEALVAEFEADPGLDCVTGAILVRPDLIEAYPRGPRRLLRRLEFAEYAQAFLAGRTAASELGGVYTISGAFSGFRNSAIHRSWMYNTETVAEDAQITSQMRYRQGQRVRECPGALFFVDPIESLDKLYTQRQRWQRGSLEVAKLFADKNLSPWRAFTDVNTNTLMYDHTFAFPRMIWYLALACLLFLGYSGTMVLAALGAIFALYILCGYLYFFVSLAYLRDYPDVRRYYRGLWWVVALLPFYNLAVFFIRLAGIVNAVGTGGAWRTATLSEERSALAATLKGDFRGVAGLVRSARAYVNGRHR